MSDVAVVSWEPDWEGKVKIVLGLVRRYLVSELEPKSGRVIPYRFYGYGPYIDPYTFHPDHECTAGLGPPLSKLPPSRWCLLMPSVDVLFVEVLESDVGFPVNLYGTVLVRDELNHKCIYLFRRDRDNCQVVESSYDSLPLIGPSRGLVACDELLFEIDLKFRCDDDHHHGDKNFSKGIIEHDNVYYERFNFKKHELTSWLSTVGLTCAANIRYGVEATIKVKIIKGPRYFHGKIKDRTAKNPNNILLYDSDEVSCNAIISGCDDDGFVNLSRRVVAVNVDDELLIRARVWHGDDIKGQSCTVRFVSPGMQPDEQYCNCFVGSYVLRFEVSWSAIVRDAKRVEGDIVMF
uniref:DUF6598 domain-containing protein n=1 Tax=Leersia perrieri TaxID=77586 RepID=A0A0D9X445_9ORYZ